MDTQPDLQERATGSRNIPNGVIYALIIVALLLGGSVGWMRYNKKRDCGYEDAAYRAMGAMLPGFCPIGSMVPVAGASRFTCPQCSSFCVTQMRAGCPLCPICKQAMVPETAGITRAAGIPAAATAGGQFGGRMGGAGLGPGGILVCPKCGTTAAQQRGVPCFNTACPACGTMMTRAQ